MKRPYRLLCGAVCAILLLAACGDKHEPTKPTVEIALGR